ncbi:MAG: hypothetical protein KatS3mg108_1004 [Isosphaeraceae bacterium]|jgi:hypothetical protein|nr:MAG: hypothetical protein KatS3mg108_1004 [Isosphaeraceae bacterium]
MSFRFRVGKVWQDRQRRSCHVIGLLEEGTVVPPAIAHVLEHPGETVRIDSVALGGGKPLTGKAEELTLVVGPLSLPPQALEGCLLVDSAVRTRPGE